ncbi:MAG: hypothetical protein JHD16_05680 [Solirubrobacteraceae bacterium]|nr:hypothetical protein [Solirubrobacteraceae bacterium]
MTTAPPLDPTATIGEAFGIYKQYAGILLPLSFGLFAIQAVLAVIFAGSAIGTLLALITSLILGIIFQGAVVELARDVQDGTLDSSVGQLLSAITPIIGVLFVVGLLNGIAVIFGLVLLVIPGLFVLTIFAVVGPVTVVERPGIFAAFSRSRELVSGSGWQVFALILFNFVLGFGLGLVGGIIGAIGGDAGGVIATWVVNSLLVPATALIIAVAYLRLRDLKGDKPVPTGVATPQGPQAI